MRIIDQGHQYELSHLEGDGHEILSFIKKESTENPGELQIVSDGTTNEEVLRVLIDRMNFLQVKKPCRENAIVITKLEECLMWLEKRTAGRVAAGVEGTSN